MWTRQCNTFQPLPETFSTALLPLPVLSLRPTSTFPCSWPLLEVCIGCHTYPSSGRANFAGNAARKQLESVWQTAWLTCPAFCGHISRSGEEQRRPCIHHETNQATQGQLRGFRNGRHSFVKLFMEHLGIQRLSWQSNWDFSHICCVTLKELVDSEFGDNINGVFIKE